ncbi:MAG TPA: divalent-cation tolerance protein CutA [Candidatus Acidoferrales bacterium]|jgi:periplasmic divalent cation tolerance protein|nr:divalent-cation tolerance protein CutA [Candidatus Acidoferrales bacterium]
MTDKIVVLSTCANEEEAGKLARALVEERLAACVSIVPGVKSFYHWKGAVESSAECLLVVKSSRALFAPLRAALDRLHSYDVPEVLALPIVDGAPSYLDWLDASIGGGTAKE